MKLLLRIISNDIFNILFLKYELVLLIDYPPMLFEMQPTLVFGNLASVLILSSKDSGAIIRLSMADIFDFINIISLFLR